MRGSGSRRLIANAHPLHKCVEARQRCTRQDRFFTRRRCARMAVSDFFVQGRTGMIFRAKHLFTIAACGVALAAALPAQALTMQECSAKYKAAQTAGSLNGQKWNDFRKEQCGSDVPATPSATPAAAAPKSAEAKSSATAKTEAAAAPASPA